MKAIAAGIQIILLHLIPAASERERERNHLLFIPAIPAHLQLHTTNTPTSRHHHRHRTKKKKPTTTSFSFSFSPAFQFKNKNNHQGANPSPRPTSILQMNKDSSCSNPSAQRRQQAMSDASTYSSFASAAVDLSQASVHPDNHILTFTRSARDIDGNTRRKFLHHILLNRSTNNHENGDNDDNGTTIQINPIMLPPTQISSNIKARIPSPSGQNIAIFTKADDEQVVEIWTDNGTSLRRKVPLPKSVHGDICYDTAWFGSLEWNHDETALVYSAEMNPPRPVQSFFELGDNGNGGSSSSSSSSEKKEVVFGGTNTLGYGQKETWGEKYTTTSRLKLFILQIETGKIAMVPNVPGLNAMNHDSSTLGGYSLGQAVFSPDGKSIVYTAWDAGAGGNMPKRLGSM